MTSSSSRSVHASTLSLTLRKLTRWITVTVFACGAALWLWTSLIAIANFAFRYPAFDQFRLYRLYLGLPFPTNAIQLENGHRPILPALVRLAEIRWFDADQILQIVAGCSAALLALIAIVVTIAREKTIPATTRAGACLLAVIALFWLGNARMLMHGNELVHTYFVVLFTALAVLAVHAARLRSPVFWMGLAGLCCFAATFSFGTGMASFGAVLLLGVILRLRLRDLAIPVGLLVVALTIYLLGLPGNDGVRGTLLLDPIGNLAVLTRWLSAPWMRTWLGHTDPSIEPWLQSSLLSSTLGQPLVISARWLASPFGEGGAMLESVVIGGIGVCALLVASVHAWRRGKSLSATRVLAFGLSAFGIGVAVIVCFARLHAFGTSPSQVFADRYLPWSCLFWLGLALYAIAGRGPRPVWRTAGVACAVVLTALAALPSHRALAGWSAAVSRHIQQSAVAAQLGIWDAARLDYEPAATNDDIRTSLDLLKQRHLSMFAEPAFNLVEHGWHAPAQMPAPLARAYAHVMREFDDPQGHRRVADFEGWMPRVRGVPSEPVLVVVDAQGAMRGLAKLSFIGPGKDSLRFNIAHKRGFDGYVLDPQADEHLSVLVLDTSNTQVLATIPLHVPNDSTPGG
ncbi:hypothetical protein [Dokdonella soli]|uniref:Uncharacterized protein n=1 Tax=Dokdonella soli TaxID=529810 RepID=A0ABN1IHG3_9GAMM